MTLRRHGADAGASWRKWTDDPAVAVERAYRQRLRRERRIRVAAFLAWCVTGGAWAAVLAAVVR